MGLDPSDPLNTTLIASRTYASGYRQLFKLIDDTRSEWIDLVEGEKYYMFAKTYGSWGWDHFVTGVEINQTEMVDHHHSMKEIQYIEATVANATNEVWRITVANPSEGGKYYLSFQITSNLTYWSSGAIPAGATTSELKNAIKYYYSNIYGSDIDVNRTQYDVNGTITTNDTLVTSYVYHIVVKKYISEPSISAIIVSAQQTSATVTYELPSAVQLSSAPLSGKFRITCPIEGND